MTRIPFASPDLSDRPLRIGSTDYHLVRDDALDLPGTIWGVTKGAQEEIVYQANWPSKVRFAETLIHEINHAIWNVYWLNDQKDDEERIVSVMATAWAQIYRDNAWLLDLLRGHLVDGGPTVSGATSEDR